MKFHSALLFFGVNLFLIFNSSNAHAECYKYDDLGRLISVGYIGDDNAEMNYDLDKHGNRKQVEITTSGGTPCASTTGATDDGDDEAVYSSAYDVEQEPIEEQTAPPEAQNTPPIADNETVSLSVNQTQSVSPLDGDTDPDGDQLTLAEFETASNLLSISQSGNDLSLTAGASPGSGYIDYTVSDGHGGSATGRINFTITEDSDPDGDPSGFPGDADCGNDALIGCQ